MTAPALAPSRARQVPSYPTAQALALLEAELGRPASELFSGLEGQTPPIAAASLGQVYRCRVRATGRLRK